MMPCYCGGDEDTGHAVECPAAAPPLEPQSASAETPRITEETAHD